MKKLTKKSMWLICVLVLICVFVFSACNSNERAQNLNNSADGSHKHEYGEWTTTVKATCIISGEQERVCSCGEKEKQNIKATGHTEVTVDGKEPTCKAAGLTEGKYCSVCDLVIVEQTTIPLKKHTYDNDKDDKCNVCDYVRDISCKHTKTVKIKGVVATCIATGLTDGKKCSGCGEILEEQKQIPLGEHTAGKWIVDKSATCIENGSKHQICSVCSETIKIETLLKTGHVAGDWITDTTATCVKEGSKHQECSVCSATIKTETLPKIGHTAGKWITDTSATCTKEGSKHQECSVCSFIIKTEKISKIEHSYIAKYTAPSGSTKGYTTLECQGCKSSKKEDWNNISINLNYASNGYNMYELTIKNVTGGAVLYENGSRVKNNYSISIVNVVLGAIEKSGSINESTGVFRSGSYLVNEYCKYNVIVSDGYSTYVFSTDYNYQYPILRNHITPSNDNTIKFSVNYDKHDRYDVYRLRIDQIYSESNDNSTYTVKIKNLVDNTSQTYSNIKEYVGIIVNGSYTSYSNNKYEITISDGTYTYVYTTSIGKPDPQIKS